MSGGHYGYFYSRFNSFIDSISLDIYSGNVPSEVVGDVKLLLEQLRDTARITKILEWYMSGDIGEHSLKNELRNFRMSLSYVDLDDGK